MTPTEMEKILELAAHDMWENALDSTGRDIAEIGLQRVLKRRLLPLLEAGDDMRYQEWPEKMDYGPARDWDAAKAAALKDDKP